MSTKLETQLDKFIAVEADKRSKRQCSTGQADLDVAVSWFLHTGFEDGAQLLKPMVLKLAEALEQVKWHHEDPIDRGLGDDAEQALNELTKMLGQGD